MKIVIVIAMLIIGCQDNNNKNADNEKGFSINDYVVLSESNNNSVTERISIPTVQCGMCDMNIAEGLENLTGLEKFAISIDNKITEVIFNPNNISLMEIEKAISMTGYQANDMKADPTKYSNLMNCCKLPKDRG